MLLYHRIRAALVGLALVWAAPLTAQAPAPKPLVITARNVTAEAQERAAGEGRDVTRARPGDLVRYSLVFTNTTPGAVQRVQFVDPLPGGLVYVLGSAKADQPVKVEYSIDGGRSYSAWPVILVVEGGKRVEKPAPREAYTHIRWTVLSALAPAAQMTAEFVAQVKAASGP